MYYGSGTEDRTANSLHTVDTAAHAAMGRCTGHMVSCSCTH